ncbi:hypothetical protein [Paraferrimonas sedimenticola]|uniref:3'-phosphoadenosine 5'-phosphosulfate sulfotransferase (PAPS reductase)/FAD synthetase n=1 Tax=Paraferrimonas sedimenticola TaxID=375674 RepID=A0AA37RVG5_9GAMM|nr:hypothetical protein [Paraferrimonas sedimenticola]GLP95302.1 hypothetical protein GCM10007895_06080 [Paraferrimonas sedimenticola]
MTFKRYNPDRINVLSSGGGTQSNAMIVLISQGKLPKPDLIVMVDTEREMSNVFDYQREHILPLCEAMGIEYHIIKKSEYTEHDLTTKNDDERVLPPFFIVNDDTGEISKMPGFCSGKWKTEPFQRHINKLYGEKYATKRGVEVWLGITIDEAQRVKVTGGKWNRVYPLVEMMLTRQMCIQIVEDAGLPTPPRSHCWMCPNRHNNDWADMQANHPEEFAKAVEFEKNLIAKWPQYRVNRSADPLGVQTFVDDGRGTQLDLIQFCDTGMCFT